MRLNETQMHVDVEVGKASGMTDNLFTLVRVSKMTDTSLTPDEIDPSSSFHHDTRIVDVMLQAGS